MENSVHISQASLKRLPSYLRVLKEEKNAGLMYGSSTKIAEELDLSPIQVRKDLALISTSNGIPGKGFCIDNLILDMEDFLNLNNTTDAIVIGAGKLGKALMNYNGFENNVNVLMAFDIDKSKCDGKKIFHVSKMKNLIKRMNIRIAIITVPKDVAQEVCDALVNFGIKAIWNFAPVSLKVSEDVVIKNEDLSASLLILLKQLKKK